MRVRHGVGPVCAVTLLCVTVFMLGGCGGSGGTDGAKPRPPDMQVEPSNKVILVAWDGVQKAHLQECLSRGELPNLAAMIAQGGLFDTLIYGHATDTKAGFAEILTGYGFTVTGIYGNNQFRPIAQGFTLFERARTHFESQGASFVAIMVTGKDKNLASWPEYPYEHTVASLDVWVGNENRVARQVGRAMLKSLPLLANADSGFAFYHFSDPDHMGHRHGENSPEYNDAIIACDEWLGVLLDRLQQLQLTDDVRVFVVTDHGFDEGQRSHPNSPDAWLVTDRPDVLRNGCQWDVAPTLYAAMGIPYETYDPRMVGRPLMAP